MDQIFEKFRLPLQSLIGITETARYQESDFPWKPTAF